MKMCYVLESFKNYLKLKMQKVKNHKALIELCNFYKNKVYIVPRSNVQTNAFLQTRVQREI